jgi:two-component system, cell cycle sensor histidine kinase and response regulator CckA
VPTEPELLRLFDRSPIGMYRSDARGRLLLVNPALVAMLGYDSVEEVLALDLTRDIYLDPMAREPVLEEYRHTGFVEGRRVAWKTRTGRILTIQLHGHVTNTPEGLVFDATAIDLTEIDLMEQELRRRRDEHETTATILDLVMRQMPAIYWVVDRDLRLLRTGGAVQQILGYDRSRWIGRTLQEALAEDPSSGDTVARHLRACNGEMIQDESEYRGKMLASVIGPYRGPSGEILGAIGTCIDVTPWRALERRMVDAQRAESLGLLAGGLAHDFNNLLVAVLGNADLGLRDIRDGKNPRTALENIRTAGLRAAELTEQLLAYAGRAGAGTTRVEPGLIVEELLRIIAASIPADVTIKTDLPLKLAVRGDPAQLRQVLLNLVNNARDALIGRGGEITIRASALHETGEPHPHDVLTPPAGSFVAIDVEDDGPGMDDETRRHVFEPFFTTKQRGHGLGLAAVLGIVRAHGGGLRVISSPGTGAKFQILWPAAVTAPMHATTQPPSGSRTVLVIDDEDLVRDVVARMVEDLGYAAVTAADGQTGLAMVDEQEVDAVLVDLTMPAMSGADVVAALRQRRPNLPVVLCSGYDRDGRGPITADAYLPKPFRIDALERTLAKLLPLRSV